MAKTFLLYSKLKLRTAQVSLFLSFQCVKSYPLRSHSNQSAPYSLLRGKGDLWAACVMCAHNGPPVFLVLFCKDLARLNEKSEMTAGGGN